MKMQVPGLLLPDKSHQPNPTLAVLMMADNWAPISLRPHRRQNKQKAFIVLRIKQEDIWDKFPRWFIHKLKGLASATAIGIIGLSEFDSCCVELPLLSFDTYTHLLFHHNNSHSNLILNFEFCFAFLHVFYFVKIFLDCSFETTSIEFEIRRFVVIHRETRGIIFRAFCIVASFGIIWIWREKYEVRVKDKSWFDQNLFSSNFAFFILEWVQLLSHISVDLHHSF